jgi:hypothetical protein
VNFFGAFKYIHRSHGRAFLKALQKHFHFFKVLARKLTVLFQASAASVGRYPSLLLGFSKA